MPQLCSLEEELHSKLKVPIHLIDTSLCSIKDDSGSAELVKKDIYYHYRCGHNDKKVFETIHRTFREIRQQDQPFGGVTVLISGDWRQCLPVVPRGGKAEILYHTYIQNVRSMEKSQSV